jgi:hypothetical protein
MDLLTTGFVRYDPPPALETEIGFQFSDAVSTSTAIRFDRQSASDANHCGPANVLARVEIVSWIFQLDEHRAIFPWLVR